MRRATAVLAALFALGSMAAPAVQAAAVPTTAKIVLIVGATGDVTSSYRSDMDVVAATAAKYSTNIVKLYSPNATWAAVRSALQGATVVVYMGHGNGFPSPYLSTLMPDRVDGFGLNAAAGQGDNNNTYYGESYIAGQVRLAPNAVVILSHLCYASGNSEPGQAEPSLATAKARLDNFAAGFVAAGASTVIADGHNNPSYYLDSLFTTHQTMDQLWRSDPWSAGNVFSFPSSRSPGFTALADPNVLSGGVYSGFYRSFVGRPGVTTDDSIAGTAPPPAVPPSNSTYHPIAPVRVLDTRISLGAVRLSNGVPQTFAVAGPAGVPTTASAVTGNLTVVGQTRDGYVSLTPAPTSSPTTSTLNFPLSDIRANGVTMPLGAGGSLSATYKGGTGSDTTELVFDVTGYYGT
ncbi:MAG: hypothetical protein NVS9B8_11230 [Candidatus Limnocylindrales bacterium]